MVPGSSKTDLVVDSTGRVLADQPTSAVKLVTMCMYDGVTSSKVLAQASGCKPENFVPGSFLPASFNPLLHLASALKANPVASFSELALSASGELDGRLASGVAVRFGSDSQLSQKLRALQLLLAHASTAGYTTIDVRVPQEPVLSNW